MHCPGREHCAPCKRRDRGEAAGGGRALAKGFLLPAGAGPRPAPSRITYWSESGTSDRPAGVGAGWLGGSRGGRGHGHGVQWPKLATGCVDNHGLSGGPGPAIAHRDPVRPSREHRAEPLHPPCHAGPDPPPDQIKLC